VREQPIQNPEPSPTLIIGIGNPSRGDDALGPWAIERLAAEALPGVDLLTDFQLQVEYALDIAGRQAVVFIDAAASGPEPFEFRCIAAAPGASHTSHALAPEAVLAACSTVGVPPPDQARVLAIRGYDFSLGADLSPRAADNLAAALKHLLTWIARSASPGTTLWSPGPDNVAPLRQDEKASP
jgi:hydrogenase maturation protease